MKKQLIAVLTVSLFSLGAVSYGISSMEDKSPEPETLLAQDSQKLKLEDLLTAQLEGVKGTEVVVSRVTIPANSSLPKHWHPGEEFGYVLEGSVVIWQEGKPDVIAKKGEVLKVPLKQVHTAMTREEGSTLLVFRVHEQGKPARTNIE